MDTEVTLGLTYHPSDYVVASDIGVEGGVLGFVSDLFKRRMVVRV